MCVCIICNLVYGGNYQKNQLKELKAVDSKESKMRRGLLLFVMNFFDEIAQVAARLLR